MKFPLSLTMKWSFDGSRRSRSAPTVVNVKHLFDLAEVEEPAFFEVGILEFHPTPDALRDPGLPSGNPCGIEAIDTTFSSSLASNAPGQDGGEWHEVSAVFDHEMVIREAHRRSST